MILIPEAPCEAAGSPFNLRLCNGGYFRYEVVRPLRVAAGKAAPWFDQPGGGMQYKTERPIQVLIDTGYLKPAW